MVSDIKKSLDGIELRAVALGYGRDVRESLPAGFGFLVPRSEGLRMMAATLVHNKIGISSGYPFEIVIPSESRDLRFASASNDPSLPNRRHHALGNFVTGIRGIARHPGIVATNLDSLSLDDIDADNIMQRQRLVDSAQLVKAIRPRGSDCQAKVDLRE